MGRVVVIVAAWLVRWDAGVSSTFEFSHAFYGSVCAVGRRRECNSWALCNKFRLTALVTSLSGVVVLRAFVAGRSRSQSRQGDERTKGSAKGKKEERRAWS